MNINIKDNSHEVLRALDSQKEAALEAIGLLAEGYAKSNLTEFPRVDTGRLRNSVSHARNGDDEYIGTNVEYAPYVELGTGVYAETNEGQPGGGRSEPWFYKDDKGVGHITKGMKPAHFLKKAV
ncbi:MAG: HK97 gp10 family phage protein, partial [Lachnospiraceae bacterium]|nr:HK97 gp10 family phage protein [Lachnospiraceae bacterium]MDY4164074.1 HK97 gp10 family phage protein [Lachnospiraceae bacterium]